MAKKRITSKPGLIKAIFFAKELAAYLDENRIPFGFVRINYQSLVSLMAYVT